jgi:hypothetical protein
MGIGHWSCTAWDMMDTLVRQHHSPLGMVLSRIAGLALQSRKSANQRGPMPLSILYPDCTLWVPESPLAHWPLRQRLRSQRIARVRVARRCRMVVDGILPRRTFGVVGPCAESDAEHQLTVPKGRGLPRRARPSEQGRHARTAHLVEAAIDHSAGGSSGSVGPYGLHRTVKRVVRCTRTTPAQLPPDRHRQVDGLNHDQAGMGGFWAKRGATGSHRIPVEHGVNARA